MYFTRGQPLNDGTYGLGYPGPPKIVHLGHVPKCRFAGEKGYPRPNFFWEVSLRANCRHFYLDPKKFQIFRLLFSNLKFCPILPGHMQFLVPLSAKNA